MSYGLLLHVALERFSDNVGLGNAPLERESTELFVQVV
jgi:hypothetical protein